MKIESYIHQNIHATIDSHILIDSLNKIMNNSRLNYFLNKEIYFMFINKQTKLELLFPKF